MRGEGRVNRKGKKTYRSSFVFSVIGGDKSEGLSEGRILSLSIFFYMFVLWDVVAGFLSQGPGTTRSEGPCLSLRRLSGYRGLGRKIISK